MDRHDLTDAQWAVIQPLLSTMVPGVPRVDDRRVINGILWRFRAGALWRDVPERYGPRTTLDHRCPAPVKLGHIVLSDEGVFGDGSEASFG